MAGLHAQRPGLSRRYRGAPRTNSVILIPPRIIASQSASESACAYPSTPDVNLRPESAVDPCQGPPASRTPNRCPRRSSRRALPGGCRYRPVGRAGSLGDSRRLHPRHRALADLAFLGEPHEELLEASVAVGGAGRPQMPELSHGLHAGAQGVGRLVGRPEVSGERRRVGRDVAGCGIIPGSWARSSMAEQLTLNQRVEGSSPSGLTIILSTKRPSRSTGGAFDFSIDGQTDGQSRRVARVALFIELPLCGTLAGRSSPVGRATIPRRRTRRQAGQPRSASGIPSKGWPSVRRLLPGRALRVDPELAGVPVVSVTSQSP